MKAAPITQIRTKFDAYSDACREEPVLVTKEGKMIAVLVSVVNEDELKRLLPAASSAKLRNILLIITDLGEGKGARVKGKGFSCTVSVPAGRKQRSPFPTSPFNLHPPDI